MTRVEARFDQLKAEEKKAFIAYLTAGDPTLEDTVDIVLRFKDQGVDIIELAYLFRSISGWKGQSRVVNACVASRSDLSRRNGHGRCLRNAEFHHFLCLVNPLLSRGFETAIQAGVEAGADGFLLLDLPVEESKPYRLS